MNTPWPAPLVGDLVWCWFPQPPNPAPGPKARPALVIGVETREDGVIVSVVYGTSQRLDRLTTGEFAITRLRHPQAFALAGLAFDTKFNFRSVVDLPWGDAFFKVSPRPRYGQTPKLGSLHPSLLRSVQAAYQATKLR